MKRLFFLLVLIKSITPLNSQSVVNGVVLSYCNNKDGAPVPDASITAVGASQVKSRPDGSFTLKFSQEKPGDDVDIVITALDKKVKFAARTSHASGSAMSFALCKENNNKNTQGGNRPRSNFQPSPEETKRGLDEMTSIVWRTLPLEIQKTLRETDYINNGKKKGQGFTEESLDKIVDTYYLKKGSDSLKLQEKITRNKLKALLYLINNQFDKAEKCYKNMVELDRENVEYIYDYITVLRLRNIKEAITELEYALTLNQKDDIIHLKILNVLTGLYIENNENNKARVTINKGLGLYKTISKDTSRFVDKQVLEAKLHETNGVLYAAENQFDNAIKEFQTSKAIYTKLNTLEPGKRKGEIASANVKLSTLNTSIKNYKEALDLLQQSLKMYEELYLKDTDETYLLSRYDVSFKIAKLYYTRHDFKTAQDLFTTIGNFYRRLSDSDPDRFQENMANILMAEGHVLHDQSAFGLAVGKFEEALKIYTKINEKQAHFYDADVASALNARGKSLCAMNKLAAGKKDYDVALAINSGLEQKAPEVYGTALAESYSHLGTYFLNAKQNDSAYYYLNEALKISEKFDQKDKRVYRLFLVQNKQNLATFYFKIGKKDVAKKEMEDVYRMAQDLVKQDSAVFLPEYATTVQNLGLIYLEEKENEISIRKLTESLSIYQRLSKDQPEVYELPMANIQYALGTIYSLNNNDQIAVDYYNRAEKICRAHLQNGSNAYAPILAQVYLAKAGISQNAKNYADALKNYEESGKLYALLLSQTNLYKYRIEIGDIKLRMAQIYVILKDYQRAENSANETRQAFIDLLQENPDLESKKVYISNLAAIERSSAELNIGRGRKHEALENCRRSQNYYKQLRAISATFPPDVHARECSIQTMIAETQESLGQDQIARQEIKSVIDTISNVLQNQPDSEYDKYYLQGLARAYGIQGGLFFKNAPDDALASYSKSTEIYTKAATVLQKSYAIEIALNDLNIGSIYLNLQDNKNAIANFEEALSHAQDGADSPDYTRVFVRANQLLGNIYFHEEAYEDSWKYYSKCMEADAQLKNFLSPFDVLELKEKAGISCVKSSDNNDKQSCKSILMKAKDFLNHQNWPQEQRTKVEEIGKKIDLYLN